MSKNVMRLLVYMMIAVVPLWVYFFSSYAIGKNVEYTDLIPEICYINIMICAYTFMTCLNNNLKKILIMAHYMFCLLSIMLVSIIYALYRYGVFFENQYGNLTIKVFWLLIIFIVINVLLAVCIQLYVSLNNINSRDYENKYEDYLLKKIDLKQQSNENPREEVKSNKVVQDSEPNTDILSVILKNENEIREYFKGSEPDTDIFAEMLKNYHETREYFKISKFQSKFSFFVSVFAAIAGFIILTVAIYGIIDKEHLEVSIIAAVSGAITEIASVVVLGIHNKSALQLNYYYDALHENEKLLSAINMADKLREEKREEMYIEIIREQIGKDSSEN